MQQQQVLSYAFQLGQDSICSSVSSHPHQILFYCTVNTRSNLNQSLIYRLKYSQQNPRKSTLTSSLINHHVNNIHTIAIDNSNSLLLMNLITQDNQHTIKIIKNQQFDQNNIDIDTLQNLFVSKQEIINIQKSKDKQISIFLTTNKSIALLDPNKPMSFDQLLKCQQDKTIIHSSVDPTRGYFAYSIGNNIYIYDKQSKSQKFSFKVSPYQSQTLTNIDFNPNKQFYLMTGHHDFIKFWDIRKTNIPLKIVQQHHSLLLKTIYNHAHDQLLLGCYDDGAVGLYRMSSVSSTPSGQGTDALVKIYDQHQDSVYHACWSHSPWGFASVSYCATNLVVNIVPSVQKYRILL